MGNNNGGINWMYVFIAIGLGYLFLTAFNGTRGNVLLSQNTMTMDRGFDQANQNILGTQALVADGNGTLSDIEAMLAGVAVGLNDLTATVNDMGAQINQMSQQMGAFDTRLNTVEGKINGLENKINGIDFSPTFVVPAPTPAVQIIVPTPSTQTITY